MKTPYLHNIIEKMARDAGKTAVEFLQKLFDEHKKIDLAAMELGVSRQVILYAAKKYKVTRQRIYDFEYLGIVDSLKGHCDRHGLNYENVLAYRGRKNRTSEQALNRAIAEKLNTQEGV